jgi:hypothetical protein
MQVLNRAERGIVCRFTIAGDELDPQAAAAELGAIGLPLDEITYRGQYGVNEPSLAFRSEFGQHHSAVDHVVGMLKAIAPFRADIARVSANSRRDIVVTFLVPDAERKCDTSLSLPADVLRQLHDIAAGLKVEVKSFSRSSLGIRLSRGDLPRLGPIT